jgi:hypothetical protein
MVKGGCHFFLSGQAFLKAVIMWGEASVNMSFFIFWFVVC